MGIKINISVFKNNKLLKKDKVFQFFTPEQLDSNNINMEIIYNKCKDKNNGEPFNIGENLQSYTSFELKEKYQIDISSQDEEEENDDEGDDEDDDENGDDEDEEENSDE